MAGSATLAAFKARMAGWTACPVWWPGERGEVPANASAYLVVTFPVANEGQITVGAPGANLFREEGAARLVLYWPVAQTVASGLDQAGALQALFRNAVFDGVVCWTPSSPVIADDSDTASYFALSIAVPYQRDYLA